MKKRIFYFCLFICLSIIAYFFVSSYWHSNIRFKTVFGNVETYSGEEQQDFFLNYYLTQEEKVVYFDYRKTDTYLKMLDLKSGEKQILLSLKEYDENKNFSFQESQDYYNIISNSFYLQYDKKSFQTKLYPIPKGYQILFNKNSNQYFFVFENKIFNEENELLYETNFQIDKISFFSNDFFVATSYDNELFLIDYLNKKSILIHSSFLLYTIDENEIYVISNENRNVHISTFTSSGICSKSFQIKHFYIYSAFSKNGYMYFLSKTEKGGEMRIVNLEKQKLSEKVIITPTKDTKLNLDCLLLCENHTVYLPTRSKEFNFDTSVYITTQKLMRFQ